MRKAQVLLLVCALAVLGMACAQQDDEDPEAAPTAAAGMSLELGDVPDSVEGNVVTLPVTVSGVEIKAPDGDTSGDSGHFHVFVDGDPVAEGEVIPRERGIVHSAENPVKIWGLEPGEHEFTVVVGDGTHKRIHEDLEDSVTVDVEGPSVRGTAPATLEEGEDLEIELESDGVEIMAADDKRGEEARGPDRGPDTGHFHLLIDPAEPPEAGALIPAPVANKIIHTTESSATVEDLAKGEHTIWVVLGDGKHYAFEPAVMDKLTVTVE